MHFVKDLAFQFQSRPARVGPSEFGGIYDARDSMWSIGLETRRWIGIKILRTIDTKTVASAGDRVGYAREVSARFRCQRKKFCFRFRSIFENNIDFPRLRRPNAKMRLAFTDQFGANRIATVWLRHHS